MNTIPDITKVHNNVRIGIECSFGEYSVIGYQCVDGTDSSKTQHRKTHIGKRCLIGSHVVIYQGSKIEDGTLIEDFCRIGESVIVGEDCRILYGARIYEDTKIEAHSIIAGFCCERAKIGKNVRLFGDLIHRHGDPHLGWDEVEEDSPVVEDSVFIGSGAKIIGGIRIGENSYIMAGAIVTRNVPRKSIVSSVNNIRQYKKWPGKLKDSGFFEGYSK